MAVGSAFTAIVNSFVKDILGGIMGWLMGDVNLEELVIRLGEGETAPVIKYGSFIQNIIYFLIIAMVMFSIIKIFAKINVMLNKIEEKLSKDKEEAVEEVAQPEPEPAAEPVKVDSDEVVLLKEIRDLLKENKQA